MENRPIMGIAWFKEDDWEEWKRISEDELEDKYDEWLIGASLTKLKLENEGFTVKKVTITPANFMKWALKNKKKNNSYSRSEYVVELLGFAHS